MATTSTPLCSPAPDRIAIIISAPIANRLSVSVDPVAVLDTGFTLHALNDPIVLDIQHHGAIVMAGLRAIMAAAGETIGITEVYLAKQ